MAVTSNSGIRTLLLLAAAVVIVFGVLGLLDLRNVPWSGYWNDPGNHVIRVFPDSPAERAGFQVGDRIRSSGGIATEDTRALTRRPRAKIGETWSFVVERDGETRELELTFAGQPSGNTWRGVGAFVTGLCFLLFCLWAYLVTPSPATRLLALFGLCFGVAFLPGPYSSSFFLRTLGGAFATVVVVLGFAFLVHYLQLFPRRRPLLEKRWALGLIYAPALVIAVFLLFLIIVQPEGTSALTSISTALVSLFIVGYFGWALVTILRSFFGAGPEERSRHGLGLVLAGVIVGLLPIMLSSLLRAVAPQVVLPGVQYYALALVLIPITLSIAAVRSGRAEAVG